MLCAIGICGLLLGLMLVGFVFEVEGQERRKKRGPSCCEECAFGLYGTRWCGRFIMRVKVLKSAKATYFSVCGFRHGYFGMQEIMEW